MRFVVKDLLITVADDQLAVADTDHCTGTCCLNPCSYPSCDNNSCVATPVTGSFAEGVILPADLADLKAQLLAAVADVERRQGEVNEAMAPKNLQEVEAVEGQLRAALDEVQVLKQRVSE